MDKVVLERSNSRADRAPSRIDKPLTKVQIDRAPSRASVSSDTAGSNVRVIARFRPLNSSEESSEHIVSFPSDAQCQLNFSDSNYDFGFDRVFDPSSSQENIFEYSLRESVDDVLNGYNGTVLAYGQTGAGKSYTMMGPDVHGPQRGVIPRIIEHMFSEILQRSGSSDFEVSVSYMEIYNERVKDLLNPKNDNLPVHENRATTSAVSTSPQATKRVGPSSSGFYVKGLTASTVKSAKEVYEILEKGIQHRAVASTNMNQESSRSHSIICLGVNQKNRATSEHRRGQLFLVDLAGSEKVAKTGAVGQVLEEAKSINKSLSVLGNVINALTDPKLGHVPYRESKLTRILQESLGGNSRTSLIINCSGSALHASETLSTLRFGTRAKAIKNRATINSEFDQSVGILRGQVNYFQGLFEQAKQEILRWRSGGSVAPSEWMDLNTTGSAPRRSSSAMSNHSHHRRVSQQRHLRGIDDSLEDMDVSFTSLSPVTQTSTPVAEPSLLTRISELEAQLEQATRNQIDASQLHGELRLKCERISDLEAELSEAKRLTDEERRNRGVAVMRHNLNALNTHRRELIEQNDKLKQSDRVNKQLLRGRNDRIKELEQDLSNAYTRLEAEQQMFASTIKQLEQLGPRVAAVNSVPGVVN